jgi:hypothetical protein
MSEPKERFTDNQDEAVFEMEVEDLKELVVAPDQDPYSDRPMEYLGQSGMMRMMHLFRPTHFRQKGSYRLILRMPSEKASQETVSQAKALIRKYATRMIEDNENRIIQIKRKGRRLLPYAIIILLMCMALGILFGLEEFVDQSKVLALAISEGFYIVGWIALWRPMDVLLFDPMEVRMENRLLRALMDMHIDVVPR